MSRSQKVHMRVQGKGGNQFHCHYLTLLNGVA